MQYALPGETRNPQARSRVRIVVQQAILARMDAGFSLPVFVIAWRSGQSPPVRYGIILPFDDSIEVASVAGKLLS